MGKWRGKNDLSHNKKYIYETYMRAYIYIYIYIHTLFYYVNSSQFSHSAVFNSVIHGLQHTRLSCPSPTTEVCLNLCPSRQWSHPTISSSVPPSPSSLKLSQHQNLFQKVSSLHPVGQSTGASASASILPMTIQSWFPLWLTGLISLHAKGLSRVFHNTTVQKHQFFDAHFYSWSNSQNHILLLEKP